MPKATVSTDSNRHDLKTLPGGFVCLKLMPYGARLSREQMAVSMKITQEQGKRGKQELDLEQQNQKIALLEFSNCITEHNLEDEHGNLLNFARMEDIAALHPLIGKEIGDLINEMHDFENLDEEGKV